MNQASISRAALLLAFCIVSTAAAAPNPNDIFIRANQVGYGARDVKIAMAFSAEPLPASFTLYDARTEIPVFQQSAVPASYRAWGIFTNHVELNFSAFERPGRYYVQIRGFRSPEFVIGQPYRDLPDQLLEFMRQQRCGANPWLGAECHQHDGRTAYGPLPAGTQIDVRGGWHDAGDLLKYHLTSGNATAQMLLAYQLAGRGKRAIPFTNAVDELGRQKANSLPDILDEARWGLEWMLKMHPAPDQLYHQVADDRDHIGRRLPQNETADYGWGAGGARVVYFADGQPQGLGRYKSDSTGVANIAGRYAAAMGLAWQIWKGDPAHREFAERCLQAGREVYEMGRTKQGVQQGNSYSAPYRYEESTWADDMEWGAVELYRATGEDRYLQDAKRYALLAESESWMGREQAGHYQYYPFMNLGHFRLYDLVDDKFKQLLALYYRQGIERCLRAAERNPYRVGVPFIWCSNNLVAALATQCLLYERMTGDSRYSVFAAHQRDWLAGRNPWGYSMFTEIGTVYPKDVHLLTTQLTKRTVRGGLVDGPVYQRIFRSLRGVSITEPDPLALFQGPAVYHDDFQDYSTNEPTMDGTASAILMWALCATQR